MTSSPNVCPNDIGNEPISVIILSTVYMFLDLQTHGRGPDSTCFYEQTAKRSLNNLLYWLLCFYLLSIGPDNSSKNPGVCAGTIHLWSLGLRCEELNGKLPLRLNGVHKVSLFLQ